MSRENVEVIHKLTEAFNRHDLDALSEISDEDAEFISLLTAIEAGGATYRAPNLWVDYFAAMDEAWEAWHVEDLRVFDAGDEQAAAIFRIVGKGRSSGARVDQVLGIAYRFRGGKLWRLRSYMDSADASKLSGCGSRRLPSARKALARSGFCFHAREVLPSTACGTPRCWRILGNVEQAQVDGYLRGFDAFSRGDLEAWLAEAPDEGR